MSNIEMNKTNTALTLVLEAAQASGFDIKAICTDAIKLNQISVHRTGVNHQPQIENEILGSLEVLSQA